MGKKNNWVPFVLGAAVGAALTWLLTSEEGKKTVGKIKKNAGSWLDSLWGEKWEEGIDVSDKNNDQENGK